jgi:hypothetical protein
MAAGSLPKVQVPFLGLHCMWIPAIVIWFGLGAFGFALSMDLPQPGLMSSVSMHTAYI